MKSIILGIIGVFITLYTFLIGIDVLMLQTSKNEMDRQVSRIVSHVLETSHGLEDEAAVRQILLQEIEASISARGKLYVEVPMVDLHRGLLSVRVAQHLRLWNGKEKEIAVEKTAIMERSVWGSACLEVS